MKVTLYIPDGTTSLGLFINAHVIDEHTISTTNYLTAPHDGQVISLDNDMTISERNLFEDE